MHSLIPPSFHLHMLKTKGEIDSSQAPEGLVYPRYKLLTGAWISKQRDLLIAEKIRINICPLSFNVFRGPGTL